MKTKIVSVVLCALMFVAIFMVEVPKDVGAQVTEEWVARYNGTGNSTDIAVGIALDFSGNVYVTGHSFGIGTNEDYVTIKYDSNGNELWVARYNGPGNDEDYPEDIVVDNSSGNIYVIGWSKGTNGYYDYATVAYDSSGNQLWIARYDGPGNANDYGYAIAIDLSGNIYVTGYCESGVPYFTDITTIAYNSSGYQLWVARSMIANVSEYAYDIAIDPSGYIYVTGGRTGSGITYDYLTIAYDPSGNQLWMARYNGPGDDFDRANAIAVDISGNVYVTGRSNGGPTSAQYDDYATVAYDSNGNELWVARYNGPGNGPDGAYDIVVDSFGNVYVTGWGEGAGTDDDYATVAYDSNGNQLWVARYNGPANSRDISETMTIDSSGNVYVTGWSFNGANFDYLTVGYDPSGNELWTARYNGPADSYDYPNDIAVDSSGNIYVTGKSYVTGGVPSTDELYDYCTIKYSQAFPNQPPVADAGPDQTIYLGNEVQFNGSASYDPDGTIVTYEWDFNASDGLWWETGAPPDAFGPNPTYIYDEYGIFTATLRVADNNGSMDIDTCEITVLVPPPLPPTLWINVSLDGDDVILYWAPPSTPVIDHYLLYRSTSQTDFDFNTVWVNTSSDNESSEPDPIPLRTMWNDTNAALPGDPNYEKEYYYIIRAVNVVGEVSSTSRTVGKWTKEFPQGVSTFSLPLGPIDTLYTDNYTSSMKAEYIKYMNTTTHTWMQHNFGDGNSNNTQMKLGEGYEVKFRSQTNYIFTGLPGAMIRYKTGGFIGFDYNTNAKNLSAQVDPLTGNVTLNWDQPSSMDGDDSYKVYRSTTRDGFDEGTAVLLDTLTYSNETYVDPGAALLYNQCYYMVIPINETGIEGSSTYSIGIWAEEYLKGYDTFGIPLKLESNQSADWYCDKIPNTVGINYYIFSEQRWCWHSTRMPEGAYDIVVEITEGYQISTSGATKFTFIGV